MIVKYIRERGYQKGKDPFLTLGKEYICLTVMSYGSSFPRNIIVEGDSDGYPRLFDLNCFDIIDPRIPDEWIFLNGPECDFYLSPQEFRYDFWNGLDYRGDPNLLEGQGEIKKCIFVAVANKIRVFHGMLTYDRIRKPASFGK